MKGYDAAFPPPPAHFAHVPASPMSCLTRWCSKRIRKRSLVSRSTASVWGEKVPGRRAGTPTLMNTIEWTVHAFEAA